MLPLIAFLGVFATPDRVALASIQNPPAFQSKYPIFETDKISKDELKDRRNRLMSHMGRGSVAFFFTNPERNRNNDVDFRFRPDSNFFYLTGCEEPDSVLMLAPAGVMVDGKKVTELLFVNDRDPGQETWTGYRMGPAQAPGVTGVGASTSNAHFSQVLDSLGSVSIVSTAYPQGATGNLQHMAESLAAWAKDKTLVQGLGEEVGKMRAIKSAAEISLMRHAADASVKGHREVMAMVRPGVREYEVQATIEYWLTKLGCEFVAYPSIVGSGPNSTILHYESDRREAKSGELICMDAAGEYHGYAADVTRTFPVNGHFSPEQLTIYNLVLAAQDAGIAECKVGNSVGAAHKAARAVLAEGMKRLGLIQQDADLRRYFMHGTSHTVGLDVHDTHIATLAPGVVMTVEPGIYIKEGSPCDPKWWNIGIRIEDDILVTVSGPVNLSAGAPRKAADVEQAIVGGRD